MSLVVIGLVHFLESFLTRSVPEIWNKEQIQHDYKLNIDNLKLVDHYFQIIRYKIAYLHDWEQIHRYITLLN
jgi:hypothetical protein